MTTATVEALTAEVRVLMVGNRQVTLSVYRQLDECPREFFEPFGRVSSGAKYAEEDPADWNRVAKVAPRFEFVGKDKRSGALSRLVVRRWEAKADYIGQDALDQLQEWRGALPLIVLAGLR